MSKGYFTATDAESRALQSLQRIAARGPSLIKQGEEILPVAAVAYTELYQIAINLYKP